MITIEELAGYLPYGLKIVRENNHLPNDLFVAYGATDKVVFSVSCGLQVMGYERLKPLLRPLSSLTTEQEINGEMVVPIVELAKLKIEWSNEDSNLSFNITGSRQLIMSLNWDHPAYPNEKMQSDMIISINKPNENPYWIIKKLMEWHFDIHGLIERGDALNLLEYKTS